jgi:small subunit ribosomal protein S3
MERPMGQKVSPVGFRLGVNKTWESKWFREGGYAEWLGEDMKIRKFVGERFKPAGISHIDIERAASKCKVSVYAARPGMVIGKKGVGIEQLKNDLQKSSKSEIFLNIHEVRKPEVDAQLIAENVAQQLERRVAFRRAMKKVMQTAQKFGVKGIRVAVSGRLGGAEMSRREWYREGRVPLHTLRADIDYGFAEAHTTYGQIGCKVWLFKGEVLAPPVQK